MGKKKVRRLAAAQPDLHLRGRVDGPVFSGLFVWCRFTFGQLPLQQFYTPTYLRSAAGAAFEKHDKYALLFAGKGKGVGHLAANAEVIGGTTPTPAGKPLPLSLSHVAVASGVRVLYWGPELSYADQPLHTYLKAAVYEGNSLFDIYRTPMLLGVASFLLMLPFSVRKDIVRRKQMKYGRRLKGPVLMTPKEFNQVVAGDGIGFKAAETQAMMRIPLAAEAQHFEIIGDTGTGKTTLIMQILRQIQARGDSAIVYDPACEFVRRFYDAGRGDIILNPLDERCPYWGPAEELRRKAEAKAIAASLYQPTSDKKGEFFTETPQKIFAHLLTFGPNPQELLR